jgi:spoIIIJ-associated protein
MDHSQAIINVTQELLSEMGLSEDVAVEVQLDTENNLYQILLQSQNPALLIGYHGENLSAMQIILGQHLHSQIGEWINLSLNVNDYRERREATLTALADSVVARVIASGLPHALPPMPSNERRIIHMYLADHPQVVTTSQGEGRSRSIVISPRSSEA